MICQCSKCFEYCEKDNPCCNAPLILQGEYVWPESDPYKEQKESAQKATVELKKVIEDLKRKI